MAKLPREDLTEPENAITSRYLSEVIHLNDMLQAKRQALDDILGLALEARGLSPDTHTINLQTGTIVQKEQA